jgi:hypothetical protein
VKIVCRFSRERGLVMSAYDEMKKYYEAVGTFVTVFSEVELRLLQALWRFSGLQPVASAVLTGIKVEGAMSFINRIADAENWPTEKRDELQYIFSHLGEINKLRNDLLHYGSFWEEKTEDQYAISNDGYVHTPDRLRRRIVSRKIWDAAISDLLKIFNALRVVAWPDEISSKDREIYNEDRKSAWRYKPQQLVVRGQKSPKTPQKP